MTGPDHTAADLIRSVGLLADGPVRWGQPVPSRKPGVYLVELAAPLPTAPLDLAKVGKWLERLPRLGVDGERPTSRTLLARLAAFWWPGQQVLYIGAAERSVGGRVAAMYAQVPGDRLPHADAQWLHLLRDLGALGARVWWAETDAPEEYLDALFDAFAAGIGTSPIPRSGAAAIIRPSGALVLPWANTRRPTGERQPHGITGAVLPEAPRAPEPPRRVVDVAPGDADGARAEERGAGTTRRAPSSPPPTSKRSVGPRPAATGRVPAPQPRVVARTRTTTRAARPAGPAPEPVHLSAAALERMQAELEELTQVRRREVVARIKTAREHGDLKENAEYHAAREEQSFLEGRIQALEDRLRRAVVVDEAGGGRVVLGSVVTVETGGDELRYTIVGSSEADPAAGRLSSASPVGQALLGATAGSEVDVRTPRGAVRYRVLAVD